MLNKSKFNQHSEKVEEKTPSYAVLKYSHLVIMHNSYRFQIRHLFLFNSYQFI